MWTVIQAEWVIMLLDACPHITEIYWKGLKQHSEIKSTNPRVIDVLSTTYGYFHGARCYFSSKLRTDKALRKAEEVKMMARKLCENKNACIFLQGIFQLWSFCSQHYNKTLRNFIHTQLTRKWWMEAVFFKKIIVENKSQFVKDWTIKH